MLHFSLPNICQIVCSYDSHPPTTHTTKLLGFLFYFYFLHFIVEVFNHSLQLLCKFFALSMHLNNRFDNSSLDIWSVILLDIWSVILVVITLPFYVFFSSQKTLAQCQWTFTSTLCVYFSCPELKCHYRFQQAQIPIDTNAILADCCPTVLN